MKTEHPENNIDRVYKAHLCMGCGTCVAFCPEDAIELQETTAGYLKPVVNSDRCSSCGICLKVCPGHRVADGVKKEFPDREKGSIVGAFVAKATKQEILNGAQSGGVATTLLSMLLDKKEIEKALVTVMPKDKTLRPKALLTDDKQLLMDSQGSKYCPVPVNAALRQSSQGCAVGVVGLPCQMLGLQNVEATGLKMPCEVKFKIGLICDRILSFHAIEYLIGQSDAKRDNVTNFEFRSKKFRGWPGDVRVVTEAAQNYCVPAKKRMFIKDIFTPVRCRLCFDKFNLFSDIVLGDSWGVSEDKKGASIVLARSKRGLEVLEMAQEEGKLHLKPISPETVLRKQKFDQFQLRWKSFNIAWEQLGQQTPDFGVKNMSCTVKVTRYQKELKRAAYFENISSEKHIKKMIQKRIFTKKILSISIIKKVAKKFGYQKNF